MKGLFCSITVTVLLISCSNKTGNSYDLGKFWYNKCESFNTPYPFNYRVSEDENNLTVQITTAASCDDKYKGTAKLEDDILKLDLEIFPREENTANECTCFIDFFYAIELKDKKIRRIDFMGKTLDEWVKEKNE